MSCSPAATSRQAAGGDDLPRHHCVTGQCSDEAELIVTLMRFMMLILRLRHVSGNYLVVGKLVDGMDFEAHVPNIGWINGMSSMRCRQLVAKCE